MKLIVAEADPAAYSDHAAARERLQCQKSHFASIRSYVYAYIHACMHAYIHVYFYVNGNINIYIYIYGTPPGYLPFLGEVKEVFRVQG